MSDDTPFVIPELIDGENWTVDVAKGLGGSTNLQSHRMLAPVANDWLPAAVQLHEIAHTKWTPRDPIDSEQYPSGAPRDPNLELPIQGCEDRRIHHLLSETVQDWPQYGGAMMDYAKDIPCPDKLSDQVVLEMASRQTQGENVCNVSMEAKMIADHAERIILANPTDPHVTWDAARFILEATKSPDSEGDSEDNSGSDDHDHDDWLCDDGCWDNRCPCPGPKDEEEEDWDGEEEEDTPASWLPDKNWKPDKLPPISPPTSRYVTRYDVDEYGDEWCSMDIITEPFMRSIPRHRVIGRGKKSASEGTVPRHIHRLPIGGKIFRQRSKGRKIGGSVLVDTSGSMSISTNDIENLLKEVHHGTVAVYASDGGRRGALAVIARHYRAVREIPDCYGGGNGVDGPALGWLATQPEPRAWICDGVTTGIRDHPYGREECAKLEAKYRITRYNDIDDYLADVSQVVGTRYSR